MLEKILKLKKISNTQVNFMFYILPQEVVC